MSSITAGNSCDGDGTNNNVDVDNVANTHIDDISGLKKDDDINMATGRTYKKLREQSASMYEARMKKKNEEKLAAQKRSEAAKRSAATRIENKKAEQYRGLEKLPNVKKTKAGEQAIAEKHVAKKGGTQTIEYEAKYDDPNNKDNVFCNPALIAKYETKLLANGEISERKVGAKPEWPLYKAMGALELIKCWIRRGITNKQIAKRLNIAEGTFYEWRNKYPEIAELYKFTVELVDDSVESALLASAINKGNVQAQMFWLKNRRPETWRETRHEITQQNNVSTCIDISVLSFEQLKSLEEILSQAIPASIVGEDNTDIKPQDADGASDMIVIEKEKNNAKG